MVELRPISGEREPWLPLLMEADESEAIVRTYLDDGDLFAIVEDDADVGVTLVIDVPDEPGARELKNLAVAPAHRNRGVGGRAVALLAEHLRARGNAKLVVGTAETSGDAIRFYERCGFRVSGRRVGYFDRYPEPVVEDGVVAHDMVKLVLDL